jgi:Zn-dependent peptidase ImmA (M78 family)
MEDSMLVEFEGKFSKDRVNTICDAIAYGQTKLFPHESDVFINIEAIRKQGVCGDCMFEDDNEFTIRLNKSLSLSDLITTVLHELVHVKQYLEGMVMDTESAYEDRWQEIEAHALEKELTEGFNAQA